MPEVGATDVRVGREEGGEHGGLRPAVHAQVALVARHVRVHVAGVDVVDHDVLPRVGLHHPLLDPGQGTPAYLGHKVSRGHPTILLVSSSLRGFYKVSHETIQGFHAEIL